MTYQSLGQSLIPIINKLQDIFNQATLDFKLPLPQLAVVGSQSSGKSSVLEALVGRDFLPRGPDICTRRPLVLQLVQTVNPLKKTEEDSEGLEWGEFLHIPEKKFTDFEEIRTEIQNETNRVAGDGKAVSIVPIRLKIYSPDILTMTLVDLPGITRVPIGDQPSDIEKQIRDMIYEYVQHPTCVILAVSAANVDLANSDALSMARQVDPEGNRTIGILTKLDIMDRGTNCVQVLKNQLVPLRLGYIGIVNRSQEDINKKRKMIDARKNEEEFFATHPEYREVSSQCGIRNLAYSLNKILIDHIRTLLPNLRSQISKELEIRMVELELYGEAPPLHSQIEKGGMLLKILSDYCTRFNAMLDGTCENVVTKLTGGAKIRDIFHNEFYKVLQNMDWRKDLTNEMIETTIRNSSGASGSLLIPQEPFELIVRRSIKKLLEPALHCKELVQEELLKIVIECEPPDLIRFSKLRHDVTEVFAEYIRSGGQPAVNMIKNIIECEYDYINYDHPRFIGGSNAVAEVLSDRRLRSIQAVPTGGNSMFSYPQNNEYLEAKMQDGRIQPAVFINAKRPILKNTLEENIAVGFRGLAAQASMRTNNTVEFSTKAESSGSPVSSNNNQGGWFNIFNRGGDQAHANGSTNNNHNTINSTNKSLGNIEIENSMGSVAPSFKKQLPPVKSGNGLLPFESVTMLSEATSRLNGHNDLTVEITRKLVDNYMGIVQGNVSDMVPKAIMHFLVHQLRRGLQQHLIGNLYKEENFDYLMSERKDIAEKRKKCQNAIRALKEATTTLDIIPQHLADNTGIGSINMPRAYISTQLSDTATNPFEISI